MKQTNATQEEKNFIKGQLLFFRAWWHQELIVWYGGLPYVDHVIPADGPFDLPRLSFKECAEKCAEDFRAAADLLPDNWDNTTVGKKTPGKNDLCITKVCALGYMGKVLLWAASPLNTIGAQTGASKNGKTYEYDTALAQRSADGSRTGYFCQKLVPHQCNKYDGMYNWGGALQTYLPYMRVADIYLMYAEAGAAVQGAGFKGSKCNRSAVDAVNVLRNRVGAGEVATKFLGDKNAFMDEVRRERACELAFEGFRWNDLQMVNELKTDN